MVKRALHLHTGHEYAVKKTRPNVLDMLHTNGRPLATYSEIESFCEEVRTLQKLRANTIDTTKDNHHNVLQLQEFFWDPVPQELHLVTDILGISLREWVATQDEFTERRARQASKTILRALQFIHGRGVVHRDVKEENILFRVPNDLSSLTLIDFGFAAEVDGVSGKVTECNYILGSKGYIAPEIYLRQAYGCEVDMFSFGVLLFRILSGERPFPTEPSKATEKATLEMRYQVNTEHWGKVISREAKDLVHKLVTFQEDRLTAAQSLQEPWMRNHTDSVLRMGPMSDFTGPRARVASQAYIETIREVPSGASQQTSSAMNPSTLTTNSGSVRTGSSSRFWIRREIQEALTGLIHTAGYQGRVVYEKEGEVMVEEGRPIEAVTLPYHVTQYTRYTEAECRNICRMLAQRVQAIHRAHVAHRYLHPENVLVEQVPDAGLNLSLQGIKYARITGGKWPLTGRVGHSQRTTDWYAFVAPEIDSAFTHDERVDLWSLGVIYYTLLCGVGPFTGSKSALRRNKNSGRVDFEIVQPSASAQNLVRGLLKVNPEERLSISDVLEHEWMNTPDQELLQYDLEFAYDTFRDWGRRVSS